MRSSTLLILAIATLLIASAGTSQTLTGGAENRPRLQPARNAVGTVRKILIEEREGDAIAKELERVARWVRDNPAEFDEALALSIDYPEAFSRGAQDSTSAEYAAAVALLTATNDRLEELMTRVQPADTTRLAADVVALRRALETSIDRATQITVFADGNIKGAAQGESGEGPVGTGSIGLTVSRRRNFWTAMVAIASTADTVSDGFGAAMLSPGSGKPLFSGLLDLRRKPWHLYAMTSKSTWRLTTEPETLTVNDQISIVPADTSVLDAVTFGAGGLYFWDLVNGYVGQNYVSLKIEVGLSLRWLTGDVAFVEEHELIENLGTRIRHFIGFEGGMQISFGRVTGAIQVYWMRGLTGRADAVGLTEGQIVGGLSVAGDIFRGRLGR
jgi:hypothetical protein